MEPHELKSVVPSWTRLRQTAFAFGFGEVIRVQSTTDNPVTSHRTNLFAFPPLARPRRQKPADLHGPTRGLLRRRMIVLLFGIFLFFPPVPCAAKQEPSGREIVKRSDDLMRGDTQKGTYIMTVTTPQWKRRLEIGVTSKGRDRMFLLILAPAKEKGTATLRVNNEMWNYLPQVERTIKIPPSMMLQPWMGSDFANDDLVKESSVVEDYTHTITQTGECEGQDAYQITLLPKPGAPVVWEKRVMWINKKNFTPIRDEFYGKGGKLIKVLHYSKVKKRDDRLIPTHWEMISQIKPSHRTIIEVLDDVVYNKPVDDDVFTLQNLRKTQD